MRPPVRLIGVGFERNDKDLFDFLIYLETIQPTQSHFVSNIHTTCQINFDNNESIGMENYI